jgi:hypothetical protein
VRSQDRIKNAIEVKLEQSEAKKEEEAKIERREEKSSLNNLSPERRQRAMAWLNANIDPETGEGRKVFRRGCVPLTITTVLGGMGTDPWPLAKKVPPEYPKGSPNPFIQLGEFYIAGRGDWNPWGPVS